MTSSGPGVGRKPAIVGAVVLVLVIAVGVTLAVVLDGDDGPGADLAPEAVVTLDHAAGELVVYDAGGTELERLDAAVEEPVSATARGPYVLVTDADGAAAVVDVRDGDVAWEDRGLEETPRWLSGTLAPVVASAPPQGGELRLVDVASGTDLEVGAAAGVDEPSFLDHAVQVSPDGRLVGATSFKSGDSVVVDLAAGEAHRVAGLIATVGDEEVVTLERTEDAETARFIGPDGEERGTAPLPDATRQLMLTGRSSIVGVAGADDALLFRIAAGDDEPVELARPDVERVGLVLGFPAQGRIAVADAGRTLLLDTEGEEVAVLDGQPAAVRPVLDRAECIVLSGDDEHAIHDLASGDRLASTGKSDSSAFQAAANGCALAGLGLLVGEEGAIDVPEHAFAALADDGRSALVRRDHLQADLVDLADPDGEPVTLDGLAVGFVDR